MEIRNIGIAVAAQMNQLKTTEGELITHYGAIDHGEKERLVAFVGGVDSPVYEVVYDGTTPRLSRVAPVIGKVYSQFIGVEDAVKQHNDFCKQINHPEFIIHDVISLKKK